MSAMPKLNQIVIRRQCEDSSMYLVVELPSLNTLKCADLLCMHGGPVDFSVTDVVVFNPTVVNVFHTGSPLALERILLPSHGNTYVFYVHQRYPSEGDVLLLQGSLVIGNAATMRRLLDKADTDTLGDRCLYTVPADKVGTYAFQVIPRGVLFDKIASKGPSPSLCRYPEKKKEGPRPAIVVCGPAHGGKSTFIKNLEPAVLGHGLGIWEAHGLWPCDNVATTRDMLLFSGHEPVAIVFVVSSCDAQHLTIQKAMTAIAAALGVSLLEVCGRAWVAINVFQRQPTPLRAKELCREGDYVTRAGTLKHHRVQSVGDDYIVVSKETVPGVADIGGDIGLEWPEYNMYHAECDAAAERNKMLPSSQYCPRFTKGNWKAALNGHEEDFRPALLRSSLDGMVRDVTQNSPLPHPRLVVKPAALTVTDVIITITSLHPFVERVFAELDPTDMCNAFTAYLRGAHTCAMMVTKNDTTLCDMCSTNGAPLNIFREAPAGIGIDSVADIASRGVYQMSTWAASEGAGYTAYPKGVDFLGAYHFHPCGQLVKVSMTPRSPVSGKWRIDMASVQVTLVQLEKGGPCPVFWPKANDWHHYFYQAWLLNLFVSRHTKLDAEDRCMWSALPLTEKHVVHPPMVEVTWEQAVRDQLTECLHGDPVATHIMEDLLSGNRAPGSLIRGLPGVGKSYLSANIICALGLATSEKELMQWTPPLGKFVAGQYHGDVSAAFSALLTRPRCVTGLCVNLLDEMDITAQRKDCDEQVAQWLTGFTKDVKAPNFHMLCTSNNDRGIVGAILSRFGGRKYSAGCLSLTRIVDFLKLRHQGRSGEHCFCTHAKKLKPSVTFPECCQLAAEMALGLPTRAFSQTVGDIRKHHVDMGGILPDLSLDGMTLVDVATIQEAEISEAGHILSSFLVSAATHTKNTKVPILTGRVTCFVSRSKDIFVDVEVFTPLVDVRIGCHTVRQGSGLTHMRNYQIKHLRELYWALMELMRKLDGTCLQYVTDEFVDYVLGAQSIDDADEKLGTAIRLIRDFCSQTSRTACVVIFPMSKFVLSAGASDTSEGNAKLQGALQKFVGAEGLFLPNHASRVCVALSTSTVEVNTLYSKSHCAPSAMMDLMLQTDAAAYTCVTCAKHVDQPGEKGCLHVPDRSLELRCWAKEVEKTVKHANTPYTTKVGSVTSMKNIHSVKVVGCTSTDCSPWKGTCHWVGPPDGKRDDKDFIKRQETRCEVTEFEMVERSLPVPYLDAARNKKKYSDLRMCCGHNCNMDVLSGSGDGDMYCPFAEHTKPSLAKYRVPPEVRSARPCDRCVPSAPSCHYCGRLIPKETAHKLYMDQSDRMYLLSDGQLHAAVNSKIFNVRPERKFMLSFDSSAPPYYVGDPLIIRRIVESGGDFFIEEKSGQFKHISEHVAMCYRVDLAAYDHLDNVTTTLKFVNVESCSVEAFRIMCANEDCPCDAVPLNGYGVHCSDACSKGKPCSNSVHKNRRILQPHQTGGLIDEDLPSTATPEQLCTAVSLQKSWLRSLSVGTTRTTPCFIKAEDFTPAVWDSLSGLVKMALYGCRGVDLRFCQDLARNCPYVHNVTLQNSLDVSDDAVIHILRNLKLVTLDISSCGNITDGLFRQMERIPPTQLDSLRHISLSGCKKVTSVDVLQRCTSLETVDFSNTEIQTLDFSATWINLKSLNVTSTPVTDAGMVHVAKLTALTSLECGCTNLTDASIKEIAQKCPQLQLLT